MGSNNFRCDTVNHSLVCQWISDRFQHMYLGQFILHPQVPQAQLFHVCNRPGILFQESAGHTAGSIHQFPNSNGCQVTRTSHVVEEVPWPRYQRQRNPQRLKETRLWDLGGVKPHAVFFKAKKSASKRRGKPMGFSTLL